MVKDVKGRISTDDDQVSKTEHKGHVPLESTNQNHITPGAMAYTCNPSTLEA